MPERPPVPDDRAERIRIKRVYRAARQSDGKRVLVDRLWPRGLSKDRARLTDWMKEIAPSDDLRHWFHEHSDRWQDFVERYEAELDEMDNIDELADKLTDATRDGIVTLLYASKDEDHNNAVVLQAYLRRRLDKDG